MSLFAKNIGKSTGSIQPLPVVKKYKFLWTIPDLKTMLQFSTECIDSPVYENAWLLRLFVGQNSNAPTIFAINMMKCDVVATITCDILNVEGKKCGFDYLLGCKKAKYSTNCGRGAAIRIFTEKNLNKTGGLTIECEITESQRLALPEGKEIITAEPLPTDLYEKLVGNEMCSDVTFLIDGKELHAHKVILMVNGAVFKDMLSKVIKKEGKEVIDIENVDYNIFKELLRFVYVGKVNDLEIIAKDLLILSHKFSIDQLKKMCEKVLCKDLNIHNALKNLKMADFYACTDLKADAIQLLAIHIKEVVNQPDFINFDNMQLIKEILTIVANKEK